MKSEMDMKKKHTQFCVNCHYRGFFDIPKPSSSHPTFVFFFYFTGIHFVKMISPHIYLSVKTAIRLNQKTNPTPHTTTLILN